MDTTSYIALSRQIALERHMATIANNVANATTTGFRAEHTVFERVLERADPSRRLSFVQDVGQWQDTSPGTVSLTGNKLDVAVDGDGFLAFATGQGVRYGRAGHLAIDAGGQLVDPAGRTVLDEGGQPITITGSSRELTIAPDGTVSEGAEVRGRLQRVSVADQQAMVREPGGLYRSDTGVTPAGPQVRLVQGALEGSNVAPVVEMTTMMQAVRMFEGTQRLIDTHHELERKAIGQLIGASA